MNPLGGHIGSDGDGLGPKLPELFDIHVMIFAGDPESTVEGLAHYFAIDRAAAERLIEDVPIVVKRAAEPDVAAEMVDVLGNLGAQVVLLPAASAVPPETDLLELKTPSVAPQPAPYKAAAEAWGALEPVRQVATAPGRRAATVDMLAAAPMAELDSLPPSNATLLEARAPARSAPPLRGPAIDDELVIAPLYEPGEAPQRVRSYGRTKEAVSLPPASAPAVGGNTPPSLAMLHARDNMESLPPALGEPVSSVPPPVVSMAPSAPSLPDLGLGSVPPLPTLGAAPPAPPPVPNAALRGAAPRVPPPSPNSPLGLGKAQPPPAPGVVPAATQQRALYERTLDVDVSSKLPSLGVTPAETRAAAARPQGGDNYWSGRRAAAGAAAPELGEVEPEAPRTPAEPTTAAGGAPGEAIRGAAGRPIASRMTGRDDVQPVRTRSIGRALLEVLIGVAVFVYFMQNGNSILLGSADVVSIVFHGFALFAIGAGLAELRG